MNHIRRSEQGASAVEMALVMPLLILLMFGLVELSRLVTTQHTIQTAARDGARYGAAVGGSPAQFGDCDGIRDVARHSSSLVNLSDSDILVAYDQGPGTAVTHICPAGATSNPALIDHGDRVIVTVQKQFTTLVPIIGNFLGSPTLTGTDHRTIFNP